MATTKKITPKKVIKPRLKRTSPNTKKIQELELQLKEARDAYACKEEQAKRLADKLDSYYGAKMLENAAKPATVFELISSEFFNENAHYKNLVNRLEAFVDKISGKKSLLKPINDVTGNNFQERIQSNLDILNNSNSRLALLVSILEEIG
jgi:hypothetical protein